MVDINLSDFIPLNTEDPVVTKNTTLSIREILEKNGLATDAIDKILVDFSENKIKKKSTWGQGNFIGLKYKTPEEKKELWKKYAREYYQKNKKTISVINQNKLQSGNYKHSIYGYNIGCRCPICKEAKRINNFKFRNVIPGEPRKVYSRKISKETVLKSGEFKHSLYGYEIGCRCSICKEAKKINNLKYRKIKIVEPIKLHINGLEYQLM